MASGRGKRIAFLTAAVALVVLAVAAFARRDWIQERWYLRMLVSRDREASAHAIEWLKLMGSPEAKARALELNRLRFTEAPSIEDSVIEEQIRRALESWKPFEHHHPSRAADGERGTS